MFCKKLTLRFHLQQTVLSQIVLRLGSRIQVQENFFQIKKKATASCLYSHGIITNKVKRKTYVKEAKKLFDKKGIKYEKKGKLSEFHNDYFFAYCEYYIQNKELNRKTEKLRDIHGFSNMLSTCFALILILGILLQAVSKYLFHLPFVTYIKISSLFTLIPVYAALSIIFWFRMKKNINYRIRMILGIYDASINEH